MIHSVFRCRLTIFKQDGGCPYGGCIINQNYLSLPICMQKCRRPRFNSWVRKVLWRRKWQPTPVFLSGESHGQCSLVGYNPWGRKSRTWLSNWTTTSTTNSIGLIKDQCMLNFSKRCFIYLLFICLLVSFHLSNLDTY